MSKRKILITGFEPFGGEEKNPAMMILEDLPDEMAGAEIRKEVLPVEFIRAGERIRELIKEEEWDAIFCMGLAGGRKGITPERIAVNVDDAGIPDNAGYQPLDEEIVCGGPAAYFTGLPLKAVVEGIEQEGIPAAVSNTAGTYVCNHVFYSMMNQLEQQGRRIPAGFIHVPYEKEQVVGKADAAYLTREELVRGIHAAVRTVLENCN